MIVLDWEISVAEVNLHDQYWTKEEDYDKYLHINEPKQWTKNLYHSFKYSYLCQNALPPTHDCGSGSAFIFRILDPDPGGKKTKSNNNKNTRKLLIIKIY